MKKFLIISFLCVISTYAFAQISLEKDINLGPAGSQPMETYRFENYVYFSADDGSYGREMWKWDINTDEISRITDIRPYQESSNPSNFFAYQNKIIFRANNKDYVYDNSTDDVLLFSTVFSSGFLNVLPGIEFDDKLFITGRQSSQKGYELYTMENSDYSVSEFTLAEGSTSGNPANFTVFQDELYFTAINADLVLSFYKWDKLNDMPIKIVPNSGEFPTNIKHIVAHEDVIYFSGYTSSNGDEVHYFNLSTNETGLFADLYSGTVSSSPQPLVINNNELYVINRNFNSTRKLNKINLSTKTVTNIPIENTDTHIVYEVVVRDNGLIINAETTLYGRDLWQFDFNTSAVSLLHDFENLPLQYLSDYVLLDNKLALVSRTEAFELEWCRINLDTKEIEEPLFDINQMTIGSDPSQFEIYNGRLYFNALDYKTGEELWEYDPFTGQTELVKDLLVGPDGGRPTGMKAYGSKLYLSAIFPSAGIELGNYDYDTDEINLLKDIDSGGPSSQPYYFSPIGNRIYFYAFSQENGREVFYYDTLTKLTDLAFEKIPGPDESGLDELFLFDDKLYFYDYTDQLAIQFDPSNNSLINLKDVIGQDIGINESFHFSNGDEMYFTSADEQGKYHLNKWNSVTNEFTVFQNPEDIFSEGFFEVFNDKVYTSSQLLSTGNQLWTIDENNTYQQITDIEKLAPTFIKGFDTLIFFSGFSETYGRELWAYNPSLDSAYIYADIWPGPASSNPEYLQTFNNKLYFVANNGVVGEELWSVAACINLFVNTVSADPGQNNGEIDLQIQGGQQPYTIEWSNGGFGTKLDQLAPGKYTVIVKDASGCISSLEVIVKEIQVSVSEEKLVDESWSVFPNPTVNELILRSEDSGSYTIYNAMGLKVSSGQIFKNMDMIINMSSLKHGIYIIELNGTRKIIVKAN